MLTKLWLAFHLRWNSHVRLEAELVRMREEALATMLRALAESKVEGVPTTIPLHLAVLDSAEFRAGKYDTRTIPGWKSASVRS